MDRSLCEVAKNKILALLANSDGFLPVTALSSEQQILDYTALDKAMFLVVLKELKRDQLVNVEDGGIRLIVQSTVSGVRYRRIKRRRS